jgi:hypothetical protein
VADSIDLTGGRGELERRRTEEQQVPPPAQLPPGVASGTPPLPIGQAVRAIDPKHLTDTEREKLESIGWKEGEPVPSNMAEIVAAVEQQRAAEVQGDLPLPADPTTPPVDFQPVNLEDLPPEQRSRAKAMVDQSLEVAQGQAAAMQRANAETRANVAQAGGSQVQMDQAAPARPAAGTVPNVDHVPQAAPAPQAAPTPQATPQTPQAQPRTPEPAVAQEAPSEALPDEPPGTGAGGLAYCPHCGWDMAAEDIPDPDEADRLIFLQTVLGQKPFEKRYELMGGQFIVGFRSLTASEIDAIYQQAFKEREAGEIQSDLEYWERVNRYRMFLQIAHYQAGATSRQLPDALSKETNPHGTGFWEAPPDVDRLKAIESYMLFHILRTETLSRIVQNTCAQFNRLVAKLEARVEDTDFWKETAQQA